MSDTAISLTGPRRGPTLALLILALPMIGMSVSRMLIGFIDFIMVSTLGTAAQAAISPCTLFLFVIACTGMGMAQSVQTFVSQAEGRGEAGRGGAYVWQSLYFSLLMTFISAPIAMTTPLWFPLIGWLGQHPPEVQALEIQFLTIALWSVGPMTATAGLESFYNGIRRPMIGLTSVLASLVAIVVFNYLLIYGHYGFPRMGIAGSGLATVISWVVRLAVVLVPLTWRSINERYRTLDDKSFQPEKLREMVRLGGPISAQWLVDIGAWFVFLQLLLPKFGEIAMAANAVAINVMHLSFMPALGIGMALTTQVGNAIGGGHADEAIRRVYVARRVVLVYMGLIGVLMVAFGEPLCRLYPPHDPAVAKLAGLLLIWCALFQLSDALCITYSFALRGAGDTRGPAVLFFVCCWGIFVCGGYALVTFLPQAGVHGPWSMCTLYIIVLGVLLWRRFHSEKWRTLRLFGETRGMPVVMDAAVNDAQAAGSDAEDAKVVEAY